MDTTTLEYFIVIAEEKNISKAAEKLNISQPALTQQLKKVENTIGAPLFIRVKSKWELTDVGKVYINGAKNILHTYNSTMDKISNINSSNSEIISIIASVGINNFIFQKIMTPFKKLYPNTNIDLVTGDYLLIDDYIKNGFSTLAIFTNFDTLPSYIESKPIYYDELVVVVKKDSLVKSKSSGKLDLNLLKDEYFILCKTNTNNRFLQDYFLKKANFTPMAIAESSTFFSSLQLLKNGYGCTIVPKSFCDEASLYYDYYSLSEPFNYTISYGYHKGQILTKKTCALIELIKSTYANEFKNYCTDKIFE